MRPIPRLVVALALAVLAVVPAAWAADTSLHLVLTPSQKPTDLLAAGEEFVRALGRLVGASVRVTVASDYAAVVEALRNRTADLAFGRPVGYVLANREAKATIVARNLWHGKSSFTSRLFVRRDSGLTRLEDLRGKTVAFVDPASSSGYIYPMVLLMKRGLVRDRDPKTFFKDALFAGTHEAALRAVLQGRVDAATTFDMAPQVHLKDPALVAQLVSIAETPEIPEAGICARPGLPPAAFQALKRALLGMKKPEHATALKGIYDIDGFVEARDADYDPVRDALTLMDYRPRR